MKERDHGINQSLDKALSLLNYFTVENPVRGLSEISRLSSIPKATVYRLFNTFEKNGYLRKVDVSGKQNQYKLGMKFLQLGTIVSETIEIKEIALPYMKRLRDELNEDVQLVMRENNHAIYVEKLICSHPVRLFTKTGRTASLNAGACPRAILSFLEDDEIREILDTETLIKYTENTIVEKKKVWEMIKESREKGYTISFGEMEPQTIGVGAPIFDHTKKVVAAISTAGPEQRFHKARFPEIIQKTKQTAMDISKALGYKKK
ncbi:IclR family transcriptional regulator [Crassaminicella thermophila]|uniref:IclR family transcriptional regulator n=1 Tax=Crassaminicella thermophila TaxID=2599308 RepID=A0A5C0SBC9_CRATE|nr:IclR family transcriptional regulator [Crassaminicella thermophila]QEK11400.1 IclR family transcriptional regulator [Crassaminicella thermophila]